jgi:hypothetical protein
MGLGLAFAELRQRLGELDELVEQLQTVAEQDRPVEGDCLAADEVADGARDLHGLLAEAVNALASAHRIETLRGLGRERGAAWTAWTAQVEQSLEHGWHRLLAVDRAVVACWRDVAELVELALVARQGAAPGPVRSKAVGGRE